MHRTIAIALAVLGACKQSSEAAAVGECDPAKVDALVAAIERAEPAARPAIVEAQLAQACTLPPAIASFFTTTPKWRLAFEQGEPYPADAMKHATTALDAVCKDPKAASAHLSGVPRDLLSRIYLACDLARFDLVDEQRWIEGEPSALIPFFAHAWLQEQGVPAAQAKPIAAAMLRLDRTRYVLAEQTMPKVGHPLSPVPDVAVLFVTPTELVFDGRSIVTLASDRRFDEADVQGDLVGTLYDHLAEDVDRRCLHAASENTQCDRTLVLVADSQTSMEVIVPILYTVERAELTRVALVAETGPLAYGVIPAALQQVFPREPTSSPRPGKGPALWIELGKQDLAALAQRAEAHARKHAGATQAVVRVGLDLEYDALVQTLATLRGTNCDAKKVCVLPDVVVAAPTNTGEDMDTWVPGVTLGLGTVEGPLFSRDDALRTVRVKLREVRECYTSAAPSDEGVEGSVAIELAIGPKGSVKSAAVVEDTLALDTIGECVARLAKGWKFPEPDAPGKVTARYRFTFSPL